jgi:hypothetical protein
VTAFCETAQALWTDSPVRGDLQPNVNE